MKPNELNPTYLWHCHLGHINEKCIFKVLKNGLLDSFETRKSCSLGKMTNTPFIGKGERANNLLVLIRIDVCGPLNTPDIRGFQYFITFTDDYNRYGYVYLMKHKFESFLKVQGIQKLSSKPLGNKIKTLRSYRGDEYLIL